MILRKPYAFFIKQFRLIHVILTVLITYLIYRTGSLLAFFNEYVATSQSVVDKDLTGNLFNIYMFVIPFLIIIASIIILSVMYVKKKPILFYTVIILIYIIIIFIYNYTYSTLGMMETRLLDIRTVRMNRDILMMVFAVQTISVIITFIRATGFDIRKFNFGQDLEELEISEEDREEFEVEVEVDTDKFSRRIKRNLRYAKYVYVENKFLINLLMLLAFATVCFVIYLNLNVYNKVFNEKDAFLATGFSMYINESYITTEDYAGNRITNEDTSLVILEINVKNNYATEQKLDVARTELVVGDRIFFPQYKYSEKLFDLGLVYDDALLSQNFSPYLLVYEVPTEILKNNQLNFVYVDKVGYTAGKLSPKNITVRLKPRHLDEIKKVNEYKLSEEMSFEDSILGKTKLMINQYEIKDIFKLKYTFCIDNDECYDSYEYLKPDVENRYPKTILHLNGKISWDGDLSVDSITNLYRFINLFGKFQYEINGESKQQTIPLEAVVSSKVKKSDDYYIEVINEMKKADKLSIIFDVRDYKYEYVIK